MNWFDTAGIANLAKSALKEAQKTIDKALDINEEEGQASSEGEKKEKDEPGDSFFSSWGIGAQEKGASAPPTTPVDPGRKLTSSSSLWGSFAGSFFDNPSQEDQDKCGSEEGLLVSDQPKKTPLRSLSLDLSGGRLHTSESPPAISPDSGSHIREEIRNFPPVEVVFRRRDVSRNANNRLSVISSESDRRSSDSCEVVGSTPDSEQASTPSSNMVRRSGSFESVEVITSPSSVDVIQSDSPLTPSKYSSDSISPISESGGEGCRGPEEDEVSDSYTSVSETVALVTVVEQQGQPSIMLRSTSSVDTSFSETLSPRDSMSRTAGRPSCEDMLSLPCRQEEETPRLQPLPDQTQSRVSSAGSEGECLVESSSCEGTLVGSSSEAADNKETMLADAMTDTSSHRGHSPSGSDRSDLVKIGSSCHTSGDELETATSSDIEIISSPNTNGDSSSTASRQSPSKIIPRTVSLSKAVTGKVKGHNRQPSEASSAGSEEGSEVERLLKRVADMTEILEARESKLIDLSRLNASLQESNADLKNQLEKQKESQDFRHMNEEFTQRLAALERKFQQAIREKELLKKQLDQAKSLAAEKEEEMEKDQLIAELRSEGEKLSKQHLVLNNTIKKLRATEKDNLKTISSLKEQVSSVSQELERRKKAVSAKEEMEKSHIEAVNNLTKQRTQLEKELSQSRNDLSTLTSTLVQTQKELSEKEAGYRALEVKKLCERQDLEEKLREEVSTEMEALERQVSSLQSALEDMRAQLVQAQQQHSKSESALRREISEAVVRAEAAERRLEESTEAVTQATAPLTRQLRELTAAHTAQQSTWTSTEIHLNSTISQLEMRVNSLVSSERSVREQYEEVGAQLGSLQERAHLLTDENEQLTRRLATANSTVDKLKADQVSSFKSHEEEMKRLTGELEAARRELRSCQEAMSVTKAALDAEKRKNSALQEEGIAVRENSPIQLGSPSGQSSPTLSHGRISLTESVNSTQWPYFGEDSNLFETMSTSSKVYDVLRPASHTSYLETLQSQLKQKEGEVQQLQWEVGRLETDKASLSKELVEVSARARDHEALVQSHSELQTRCEALLQMYGEKEEENRDLRMDLTDVKDMYKAQIEELLRKEPKSSTS